MPKNSILIIAAVFFMCACAAGGRNAVPMSQGERLFRANCHACHVLPNREEHTPEQWDQVLNRHRDRITLSGEDRQAILGYLSSH